jgi:acetyl-CoA C-acetyltransferase
VTALIDGVDVVRSMTWAYDDLPGLVASAVGATPRRTEHSDVGGNKPVALVDRAAASIAMGAERAVLVCGGEARASSSAYQRQGVEPPWPRTPGGPQRWPADAHSSERARRYGLGVPLIGYPLYENGLRARLGQSHAAAQRWSAELLADFSAVAAKNDAAWDPIERTVEEIETVTPPNRMLFFPYPLLMVAQPMTDQAAAVVVTSLGAARDAGVPDGHVVHVWGGAGSADTKDLLARTDYSRSPAMAWALEQTLAGAGVTGSDLDVVDLYSCYPVVPKLALEILGLRAGVPRTTTGGLNAFGAPANNYSMHAVVSMVNVLRNEGRLGLVYGNGETVTKHHAILLATEAHEHGFVGAPEPLPSPAPDGPAVADHVEGTAIVETYTVEFGRDGGAVKGYVVARTPDGTRFAAHAYDPATLARLVATVAEPIGLAGVARPGDDGLNRFELQ